MSSHIIKEHLNIVRPRYKKAGRGEKTRILNELVVDLNRSRKHLIRIMNLPDSQFKELLKPSRPGRPQRYGDHETYWLQRLWLLMRRMNSKSMKEALPRWLLHYEHPDFDDLTRRNILKASASTIERLLTTYKRQWARKFRTTTRRPPMKTLKHLIPLKPFGIHIHKPGFMEADTVAHCGGSLMGLFAYTLNMTDHYSGWTEQRAMLGKCGDTTLEKIKEIQSKLPFHMKGFHCDNGTEFINEALLKYFDDPHNSVIFTRGRAYQKNDQAHVEQKNWTHVRQLFGYCRIDSQKLVDAMNDIYQNEHSLLQNFFFPQAKLKTKTRVGARYRRSFDKPKTPYERIIDSKHVPQHVKDSLISFYSTLNPFELSKTLDKKIKSFHSLLNNKSIDSDAKKEAA